MSKQQRCLNWAPARTYPRAREPRRLKKPGPVKTGELLKRVQKAQLSGEIDIGRASKLKGDNKDHSWVSSQGLIG